MTQDREAGYLSEMPNLLTQTRIGAAEGDLLKGVPSLSHAFKENQQSSTEPSGRPIQKASFDALQPNDWVEIEKLQEAANREDEAV
jgi:hypothetical protein